MNNKPDIYIHYNAADFLAPTPNEDVWCNYTNPDSAKMFALTALSWAEHGWNVIRLDSSKVSGFDFKGLCKDTTYPVSLWNIWYVLRTLDSGWCCTIDCINRGFTPQSAISAKGSAKLASMGEQWTSTCFFTDRPNANQVITALNRYDCGGLQPVNCQVTSDESVLREHGEVLLGRKIHCANLIGTYQCSPDWFESRLLHIPRSVTYRVLEATPVIK